jgi:hypothetical protein
MNDHNSSPPGEPPKGGDHETLSDRAVLAMFAIIALVCVAGYFLVLKLIDISRQEDCMLAHRRNCASITLPADR